MPYQALDRPRDYWPGRIAVVDLGWTGGVLAPPWPAGSFAWGGAITPFRDIIKRARGGRKRIPADPKAKVNPFRW
jgi:hypothetical protein